MKQPPAHPDLFDRPAVAIANGERHDDARDVAWLENLLSGAGCWMTASDIALTIGGRRCDRDIRELASQSANVLSGQKGYKHVEHATAEEVDHAANWLISQGKKMIKRGIAVRKNAHRIFG